MDNTVIVWLLVLVTPNDLVEHETFDTRAHCMAVGTGYAERAIWKHEEEIQVDGFVCEPQEPEARTQEMPACTEAVEHCS